GAARGVPRRDQGADRLGARGAGLPPLRAGRRLGRIRRLRRRALRARVESRARPPPLDDLGDGVDASTLWAMAVLIASNLRKELAGDPLFDGVSFKLERRDRLALSGPNGAGKTTLLRALVGETELQGGELVFDKGIRVALHDQRPPLERELTLREYVLSGAADLVAAEQELRRLEAAMASGDHGARDAATLRRGAGAARACGRVRVARAGERGRPRARLCGRRP